MRALTPDEQAQLETRRNTMDEFIDSIDPAIVQLADHLGHPNPSTAMDAPETLVDMLDETLPRLDLNELGEADLRWLHAHLIYFLGEYLVQTLDGHWFLQDDPESDFFLRYIVGAFGKHEDPHLIIDPLELALAAIAQPTQPRLRERLLPL